MTTGIEKHVERLERELAAFQEEMRRSGPDTGAFRAAKDRADELERDIALFKSGKYSRAPFF